MSSFRLSGFIRDNLGALVQGWEDFAGTISPFAAGTAADASRKHARCMLLAFAGDLDAPQSNEQRAAKARGLGYRDRADSAAELHAEARLLSGYTVIQLVSEYRALRSSVLSLWSAHLGDDAALNMADMTRFNEAVDQALAESVARYERLVKESRNIFLAILGHDLRNPLGSLVMGSSFIMQADDIAPKYVQIATRMFDSGKRMNKLIDDLIDFTRAHLSPGTLPICIRRNCLVAVSTQIVAELRGCHPGRCIELQAPRELNALFDLDRMAQVLSNIIGNALQYGSARTAVIVCVSGTEDQLSVAVNNYGDLIPADQLESIFDPLVRIANDVHTHAGRASLGMGLYIAREIIHRHGGTVTATSTQTQGTTFSIQVPRRMHA